MTEEQLKIWFWDKFNSCYSVKHDNVPNSIYMYYDINFIRAKKLATILNKDVEYPTEINGVCLFIIDYKKMIINYTEFTSLIENTFTINHFEIKRIIYDLIKQYCEDNNIIPELRTIGSMLPSTGFLNFNILHEERRA